MSKLISWTLDNPMIVLLLTITLAVFASGLVFKWTRRHLGQGLVQLRLDAGIRRPQLRRSPSGGLTMPIYRTSVRT